MDEEYNIKGFIDWGYAKYLPLQSAASFPRILARELPDDLEGTVPEDITRFSKDFLKISATLQRDREAYISTISKHQSSLAGLVAEALSMQDVDWRCMMWKATMSKGEHKWMADRSWLIPGLPFGSGIEEFSEAESEKQVDLFLAGEIGEKCKLGRENLLAAARD